MKTRRIPRWLVATLALSMAFMVTPAGVAHAADTPVVPVPPNTGLTDRGTGVISDADRDFVVKVRLAGLWEIPAGNMTATKSQNPVIKKIGADIALQHVSLDALDPEIATRLAIMLPNQPNCKHAGVLDQMRNGATPAQSSQSVA